MTDHNLQNPNNWDFENAEKRPGVKKPRAVVSVAFSREDFERVAEHAEHLGMKISEFIRNAALEQVEGPKVGGDFVLVSGLYGTELYLGERPAKTNAFWSCVPEQEEETVSGW